MNPSDHNPHASAGAVSPYASAGASLLANGYSAIPISPADKMPGRFSGGAWWPMKEWSRYCGALPAAFEVKLWSGWPNANVGVACGRGLLAFDIDREDLVEPIKAVLPPVVVAKRGRKGETLFYRGDTGAIRSRGFKIDKGGVLDLIADGKQTVVPPSIHPDTGAPYTWTTERTLLDTPLAALPEVTVAHVEAVIEVLRAHGYEAAEPIRAREAAGFEPSSTDDVGAWYRRLNDDALANLDAWVPRLGLTRLVRAGDGYRSVAEWRPSNSGKPIGRRRLLLSIDPKGIVDYGDGDKGYTAVNLVMAALGFSDADLDKASVWLGESIGYDFAPRMVLNAKRKARTSQEEAIRLHRLAQQHEVAAAGAPVAPLSAVSANAPKAIREAIDASPNVVEFDAALAADADAGERPKLDRWGHMQEAVRFPGLVGDLTDWFMQTSRTPDPVLSFSAALGLVGVLAGRNYEATTTLRTNVYPIALAKSGFGKDHARQCIKILLNKGGIGRFLGGAGIASGAGLRKRVLSQPSILYMVDEFGGFMSEINNKKNPHSLQIRDLLLQMYGSAGTSFSGTDYAGEMAVEIQAPNVCLYGTSTPADFWNSCRALSVADGLLGRFLIFAIPGDVLPPEIRPAADMRNPPPALVKRLQRLTVSKVGGNLTNALADGTTKTEAMLVPFENEACETRYWDQRAAYRLRGHEAPEDESALWNRVAENALKIALIVAVGCDCEAPVIRTGILEQAFGVAELCALTTLDQIAGRLADNDRQREHIDVRRWIVEAGPTGITRTTISRRVNGRFDRRRLDEILQSLEHDSREIIAVKKPQEGRGAPTTTYYAHSAFAEEAG